MAKSKVIVTGSSGYVATHLIPRLKVNASICGVDQSFSEHTDIQVSIESDEFGDCLYV